VNNGQFSSPRFSGAMHTEFKGAEALNRIGSGVRESIPYLPSAFNRPAKSGSALALAITSSMCGFRRGRISSGGARKPRSQWLEVQRRLS